MNDKWDTQLDDVTAQAVEWFSRMRDSELSCEERARFDQWIAESPVHVREYLGAAELWGTLLTGREWSVQSKEELLAQARASANVVAFPAQRAGEEGAGRKAPLRKFLRVAAAASVLLALGAIVGAWMHGDWLGGKTLSTARGEQRSMVLSDGSVIQLNTLTRLDVHFDDRSRRIEMAQGEAFFRVAHDTHRPFEVITPFGVVRALGTEFNVYSRTQDMRVAVMEGKVQVSASQSNMSGVQPTLVKAQQSVEMVAGSAQPRRLPASESKLATAWMQRRLAFEDEPLQSVVAEFNRYNRVAMRIDDAELAMLKINGVFNADDPRALIGYLQRVQGVVTEDAGDSTIAIHREKNR